MTNPPTGGRVRGYIARWLFRVDSAKSVLQMVGIGVTAASTLTTALLNLGLGEYVAVVLAVFGTGAAGFAWGYDRFGLINRKQRESMDRSDNFSGPGMAMGLGLQGRQRAVMAQSIRNDWSWEQTMQEMDRVTAEALQEYRDGIDVHAVFNHGEPPAEVPDAPMNGTGEKPETEGSA